MTDGFIPLGEAAAVVVAKLQVERYPLDLSTPEGRSAWLARRKPDITASVAGALLGVHEYQTAYGLWALRSGKVSVDPEETAPMRRGRLLEPVAVEMLREDFPTWKIERATHYYRDPAVRLGATPDVMAVDPARPGHGVVQIKNVEPSILSRKWRGEDGQIEPPLWIVVQAIIEATLTGASWAKVAVLTVSFGVNLHVIEIPIHAGVYARLCEAVAEFWRLVEEDREPPIDYARDGKTIAALYGVDNGTTIDLSGDNHLPALAVEDAQLAAEIKVRAERRKAIKAEIMAKIKDAAIATIDGQVFATAKTVQRRAYSVEATTYRDLRIKMKG